MYKNNRANIIVRLVTGQIQDAGNNSYHRVVHGYLRLSTIFLVVSLHIFGAALLNTDMITFAIDKEGEGCKGPVHIARVRQHHLEEHHQKPGSVASVFCFGLMMLMLVPSWGIYIRGTNCYGT